MRGVVIRTLVFLVVTAAALPSLAASDEGDAADSPGEGPSANATSPPAAPATAPPNEEAEEHGGQAFVLPGGIRLGGMFDAVYERAGRSGSSAAGTTRFRATTTFCFCPAKARTCPWGSTPSCWGSISTS